jgi:hypothetical protein
MELRLKTQPGFSKAQLSKGSMILLITVNGERTPSGW